jgi:PAS domain S-box-containing protein
MVVATNLELGHPAKNDRRLSRAVRAEVRAEVKEESAEGLELDVGVLFDRLLDAVVIARLGTGRIVLWNPAAEKLFGYSASEAIGQSIEILMPRPIAVVHRTGLERYVRTGHGLIIDAAAPVEMPARTKSGEEIRIEMALSELQSARGERFALAVVRDATQRKQLELTNLELVQARVAQSEAEAELSARDQLLDSVAAALESSPQPDELQRLSDDLADFRRLHGGELAVRPQDADLVDLVHVAADTVRDRAMGRRLLVHAPPTAPATFDLIRTRQVVEQILDEAVHRSSPDSRIYIGLEQPNVQSAQLTVRAEGTGYARELGLGLHLGKSLMERQGGTLTTTVTPRGGLEVVLTLPACQHPIVPKARPSRARSRASQRKS